jgi:tryptophanyl-tRNA synthetase
MGKKIIFSGIQPSGNLHIGNYIGAISQWVRLQDENEAIFCIVDLHAITVKQDPKALREKCLEVAALYLACGINPAKSKIFIQSENPDHTYLAWIFDCIVPFSWMGRMTQFKAKSEKSTSSTVGLFNYPALMAADILLYDTSEVPVGEDQLQHIELTNHIARKFNNLYGETFKLTKGLIDREASRIMSLQDPTAKMSKSDADRLGTIDMLDTDEQIRDKVKRAVTDSKTHIGGELSAAIKNLLVIYSKLSGKVTEDVTRHFEGKSYAEFKKELADVVVSSLKPIRQKYQKIMNDQKYLKEVLDGGSEWARAKSSVKIEKVRRVMGLGR